MYSKINALHHLNTDLSYQPLSFIKPPRENPVEGEGEWDRAGFDEVADNDNDNDNEMTIKISLFDINHLNTMIGKNQAEKIMWLMNRRPYKTINNVDIAGQPRPPPQKKK